VFVKKRIAAILVIAVTGAMGVSSTAAAAGDPLSVTDVKSVFQNEGGKILCGYPDLEDPCPAVPLPNQVSVGQLAGPALGDAVCTPESQTEIPLLFYTRLWVCKQPSG
jgi:hypothetical protein